MIINFEAEDQDTLVTLTLPRSKAAQLALAYPSIRDAFDECTPADLYTPPKPNQCKACNKPFPLGTRVDKTFCDAKCRQRYNWHTKQGQPVPTSSRSYKSSSFQSVKDQLEKLKEIGESQQAAL